MGNRQSFIEINGRKYDAKTGRHLAPPAKNNQSMTPPKKAHHRGNNVDGFIKRNIKKSSAKTVHSSTQKATTLMRSVVKKPSITTSISQTAKPEILIHDNDDSRRLKRAKSISKNRLISRFGTTNFSDFSVRPKHTHVPVRPAPDEIKSSIKKKPDPIRQSLEKASSHEAPKLKKPSLHHRSAAKLHISPKKLNLGLSILAGVLIISFIAQQNIYNVEMRVAATRAGLSSASLPNYTPSGFSMNGRIAYRPGQITLNYKSNSDNRSFDVKQTVSSWDSQALLENFVTLNQQTYQTYQDSGKTIYIYNGSNATWVDQGIWYQIEGNSSLNSDQLLKLANSI